MEYIILLLNNVFAFFDRLIAWAIAECYNLIIEVSASSVLDAEVVKQFSSRINVFLSLIMLFWLAFRMIKYTINPDMMSDKTQGFEKITVNVVVMLTMLVLVNYAFTFAMDFQKIVVDSKVLMRVVFGVSDKTSNPINNNEDVGNQMAYYLYAAFITPSDDLKKCQDFYGLSSSEADDCAKEIEDASSYAVSRDWVTGHNNYKIKSVLSSNVVSARDGSSYLFNYTPVISTACGLVMLMLTVSIAIDVAVRVVKLAFLQIIAPIPIISYIDPNSGQNGIFKNWLKMVVSTYLSLFVKLITIYFTVFFISYASKGEIILGNGKKATLQGEPFIIVLIIIGTLMFAKSLPKLLSEIFGINLDGGSFSSVAKGFKKAGKVAGGVARAGGAAVGAGTLGAIGGAARNMYAGFRNNSTLKKALNNNKISKDEFDRKRTKNILGSTIAGAVSAGGRAAFHSATSKDNIFKSASSGIQGSNAARNARNARADKKHDDADIVKGKLDKNKQAYASRSTKEHGGHK